MKAIVIKESNHIVFDEVDDVGPRDNEVKICVKYTGICGSDVPRALSNGAHQYPIILGHEFSGVVTEIGQKVTKVKKNDHVVGIPLIPCMKCQECEQGNYSLCSHYSFIGSREQGSMAEYIVTKEENVYLIDNNIPLLSAAFFEPSTVAYHGIKINGLTNIENACIVGPGNIGIFTIQWLKILGAKNISVVGIDDEKLQRAKKYGATKTYNISSDIEKSSLLNQQFDNLYECSGSAEMIKELFKIANKKAHLCFIGTPKKDVIFTWQEWELINRKELTLTASWMSYSSPFPGEEWQRTAEEFKKGNLRVENDLIYNIYQMHECKTAFDQYKKPIEGKILIENEFFGEE